NGDPVVRYDHLADRWLMSQLAIPSSFLGIPLPPFYQCIAVSATADPTGAYYRYQFEFDTLNDYPKFGVWPDAYYMTMNQFSAPFDSNLCGGAEACIPQPGTTAKLDGLADRLMYRLQYRNFGDHESLIVNHTVDADGTDHAGIRWYEIRDPHGSPSIFQQGTYA